MAYGIMRAMESDSQEPHNRVRLMSEAAVLPVIDAVRNFESIGRDVLPSGLSVDELDSLCLTVEAAEERRNPSFDSLRNGRRAAAEVLLALALESVDVGDVITAGNVRKNFMRSFSPEKWIRARLIGSYLRRRIDT